MMDQIMQLVLDIVHDSPLPALLLHLQLWSIGRPLHRVIIGMLALLTLALAPASLDDLGLDLGLLLDAGHRVHALEVLGCPDRVAVLDDLALLVSVPVGSHVPGLVEGHVGVVHVGGKIVAGHVPMRLLGVVVAPASFLAAVAAVPPLFGLDVQLLGAAHGVGVGGFLLESVLVATRLDLGLLRPHHGLILVHVALEVGIAVVVVVGIVTVVGVVAVVWIEAVVVVVGVHFPFLFITLGLFLLISSIILSQIKGNPRRFSPGLNVDRNPSQSSVGSTPQKHMLQKFTNSSFRNSNKIKT